MWKPVCGSLIEEGFHQLVRPSCLQVNINQSTSLLKFLIFVNLNLIRCWMGMYVTLWANGIS